MWIEKVDNERYKVKITTSLGEQTKIVHRSQLYWLSDKDIEDICNKQQILKFN